MAFSLGHCSTKSLEDIEDGMLYKDDPWCGNIISYISALSLDHKTTSFHFSASNFSLISSPGQTSADSNSPSNLTRISDIPSINSLVSDISTTQQQRRSDAIPSYIPLATLGHGTHGEVFLARSAEPENRTLYAVKVLRNVQSREAMREVSILNMVRESLNLSGPHVLGVQFLQKYREAFQNEEHVEFLVLEYHPSTLANPEVASLFRLTLYEDQRLAPRLSPPATQSLPVIFGRYTSPVYVGEEMVQALRLLVAEISMGLGFLHSRGFVHQDIKPENLLFSCSGHVVIGDFGATSKMPIISDPQETYLDDDERTCYGPIVLDADDFITFTPLYAAPELKIRTPHGQVVYDHRSDWWSLGVVLYELATGTVPFQSLIGPRLAHHGRRSDGDASLAFGQLERLSEQLEEQDYHRYLDLENFIRLMLSHRPEDRLAWPDVKDHAFLAPLRGHWDDIASLKYPPCPNPPSSQRMDETSSLKEGNNTKLYEATSIPAPSFEGLSGKVHVDDLSQSSSSRERPPGIPDVSSDTGSDEASIPQTMPSSASIWASQPTTYTLKSNLHASDSGFRAFEVAAIVDKYLVATPHLPSPFYPTPDLDAHHHHNHQNSQSGCSTSYSSEPDHLESGVCGDFLLAEDITWSLLEAMDNRDQVFWGEERKRRGRRPVRTLKVVSGIFRRIFRRLFSR